MKRNRQGIALNIFSWFIKRFTNKLTGSYDYDEDSSYESDAYIDYLTKEEKISYLEELLPGISEDRLQTLIQHTEKAESRKFSHDLFHFLNKKKISNTECRENACMSQQVFSKIINSKPGHCPEKKTVIHLALAMRLSLEETERFLNKTGYALTNRYILDLVAVFLIQNKIYDVQLLDECVRILSSPK